MSEETKPTRKEPVMQPPRIVQVDGPQPQLGMPADAIPTNPTGKKLVKSKKEIEAEERARAVPVTKKILSPVEIAEINARRIEDLDRNARTTRNSEQAPEYDMEWFKLVGGTLVTIAWLQTAISVSGYISSETTMSPQKIRGLTMSWNPELGGLLCKVTTVTGSKTLLIPSANVKAMEI